MNKTDVKEKATSPRSNKLIPKLFVGLLGVSAVVVLFLAVSGTFAQSQIINLAGDEAVEIICDGRGIRTERLSRTHVMLTCRPDRGEPMPSPMPTDMPPNPTNTPEPVPTDMPPNPTNTPDPAPTNTPDPMPTDVPPSPTPPPTGGEPIMPYADAPACEDIGLVHDSYTYHGIWDFDYGCHWDHTHNADPNAVNDVFGEPGAWYGNPGQSISHPWQTWAGLDQGFDAQPGAMENDVKHNGYKWDVEARQQCHIFREVGNNANCATRWRIQYHWIGGAPSTGTRFHSVLYEVEVCTRNMQECGIIRGGGVWDTGFVMNPYKGGNCGNGQNGDWQILPQDPPGTFNCSTPPYRGHETLAEAQQSFNSNGQLRSRWNARYHSPRGGVPWFQDIDYSRVFELDVMTHDDWGGSAYDPQSGFGELYLVCPEQDCAYNHSTALAYEIVINGYVNGLDQDPNRDGIQFSGWTNRKMHVLGAAEAAACEANGPSMDCVPLIIEDLPTGPNGIHSFARFNQTGNADMHEFDVFFGNRASGWVEWPN